MGRRPTAQDLGRRERQIMDAIFQLGEASVGAFRRSLPDPPSYSAVRTMIGSLEQKGLLKHRRVGIKYVYRPTQSPAAASRSALKHLLAYVLQRIAGRGGGHDPRSRVRPTHRGRSREDRIADRTGQKGKPVT